jgi:hypothetical protein
VVIKSQHTCTPFIDHFICYPSTDSSVSPAPVNTHTAPSSFILKLLSSASIIQLSACLHERDVMILTSPLLLRHCIPSEFTRPCTLQDHRKW